MSFLPSDEEGTSLSLLNSEAQSGVPVKDIPIL